MQYWTGDFTDGLVRDSGFGSPGRVFTSPQDFNDQLHAWLVTPNHRFSRALGMRLVSQDRISRAAMGALPPVAPVTSRMSLSDVWVITDGIEVGRHPRFWGKTATITGPGPDPVALAATLRREFNQPRIVHHAEVITLKGNSYRLKDTPNRLASEKPENTAQ